MKCTVEKGLFVQHLQKVIGIVNRKATLPILANVMLSAKDEELTLTTTNLEIRIETTLKASGIEKGGFTTTLPAHSLLAIVSNCQGTEITIECAKNFHCTLTSGNAKFKLLGLDPIDFPNSTSVEKKNQLTIKAAMFEKLINHVAYSISKDDSRKMLEGIYFKYDETSVTAVGTDGKRLAIMAGTIGAFEGEKKDIIIPAKAAQEIKKIFSGTDGNAIITHSGNIIAAECGTTKLTAKLLEGTYPNYTQIIPKEYKNSVDIGTIAFLASLELICLPLNGDPKGGNVTLKFTQGKLTMSTSSSTLGEGENTLEIAYEGDNLQMSFNSVFLAEPLKNVETKTLKLCFNDAVTPMALENDNGFQYILMPLRAK